MARVTCPREMPDGDICGENIEIDITQYGCYRPATREDPEEFPDYEWETPTNCNHHDGEPVAYAEKDIKFIDDRMREATGEDPEPDYPEPEDRWDDDR